MCSTKIPTCGIFKLLQVIYYSKYVHCDMRALVENISTLLCFLDVLGIAVPVFSYKKHPTRSSIV